MKAALNAVDVFGITFQLRTMKKSKFSTALGGCLSLLFLFLIALFSIFFGNDFYNKTNPNVVSSEKVYREANKIDIMKSDFEIMFRIEDQLRNFLEPETIPYYIEVGYNYLVQEQSGSQKTKFWSIVNPKRCSETRAAKNKNFADINLTLWLCFDWEALHSKAKNISKNPNVSLEFGGTPEEKDMGRFRISMFSSKYDDNFKIIDQYSNKALSDWGIKHNPGLLLRYPNSVVDGDSFENPLNEVYKQERFLLKPEMYRREKRIMKKVNLEDDKGWIFPKNETKTALMQESVSTEYLNHNMNIENVEKSVYVAYIELANNEIDVRRKYMKIQDLAALVGGVMKLFFSSFSAISGFYAFYYRSLELFNLLYNLEKEKPNLVELIPSAEINSLSEEKVNNLVKVKDKKQATVSPIKNFSIGILSFYLRFLWRQSTEAKERVKIFEAMKDYLDERFDLEFLLRHYDRFDQLVDIIMTVEQKEELNTRKKTNTSSKF